MFSYLPSFLFGSRATAGDVDPNNPPPIEAAMQPSTLAPSSDNESQQSISSSMFSLPDDNVAATKKVAELLIESERSAQKYNRRIFALEGALAQTEGKLALQVQMTRHQTEMRELLERNYQSIKADNLLLLDSNKITSA